MIADRPTLAPLVSESGGGARLRVHPEPSASFAGLDRWVAGSLIALFVLARLWHVPAFRVWFDEIFTLQIAQRGWGELVWFTKEYDVHPPLFYLTVKAWMLMGGQSFAWLGLYSVAVMIAALIPFFLLSRELGLRPREINFGLAMMALNGYLVGYSQELRSYSLVLLLSTCSLWLFVRYCNADDRPFARGLALAAINLLLVYTEYFGWLVVAAEGLFLLSWNRTKVKGFAFGVAASCLLYLPWVYYVTDAAARRVAVGQRAIFFIPRPSLFSVAFFYGGFNGQFDIARTTSLGLLVFGFPIVVWAVSLLFRGRARGDGGAALAWLVLFATFPVVVVFAASRILPSSVWGQRHLIMTTAPYMILIAVAALRLKPVAFRTVAVTAMLVWVGIAGWQAQVSPYKSPGWDQLVTALVDNERQTAGDAAPPVNIYALEADEGLPTQFYLDRRGDKRFQVVVLQRDTPVNRQVWSSGGLKPFWSSHLPAAMVSDVRELPDDHFWIADDGENGDVFGHPNESLKDIVTAAGFTVGTGFSADFINRRWNIGHVHLLPVSRAGNGAVVSRVVNQTSHP